MAASVMEFYPETTESLSRNATDLLFTLEGANTWAADPRSHPRGANDPARGYMPPSPHELFPTEEAFPMRGEKSSSTKRKSSCLRLKHLRLGWPQWLRLHIDSQQQGTSLGSHWGRPQTGWAVLWTQLEKIKHLVFFSSTKLFFTEGVYHQNALYVHD